MTGKNAAALCGGLSIFRRTAIAISLIALLTLPAERTSAQFQIGQTLDQAYLNVPFDAQQTPVWCWVAAARMVARFYNVNAPSQCEMLQAQYGAPCCAAPALCSRPGHIVEIQALIASFGLRYSGIAPRVDGWTLLSFFKQGRPVILHVDNSHFVVATGMKVVVTPQGPLGIVRIYDPIRGVHEQDLPTLYMRWGFGLYVF